MGVSGLAGFGPFLLVDSKRLALSDCFLAVLVPRGTGCERTGRMLGGALAKLWRFGAF